MVDLILSERGSNIYQAPVSTIENRTIKETRITYKKKWSDISAEMKSFKETPQVIRFGPRRNHR